MSHPSLPPSDLSFASLEEAMHSLPGIIRTLPEACQDQVHLLVRAIVATAIREQVAAEPQTPLFDLSRFKELRQKKINTLSPTEAQYMLRATVSYLLVNLIVRRERGDKDYGDDGYAQILQSLRCLYELSTEMIADEAIATLDELNS